MQVLITGGAGFIGSALARRLLGQGDQLTLLDTLSPQVHGPDAVFAPDLLQHARCVQGDVRDRQLLASLMDGQEAIVHLAAETGTGQSMYAVQHYQDVNIGGTAQLLDVLVNERPPALRKLVLASSRAIYGEGRYHCAQHGDVYPGARLAPALQAGQFEPVCPHCGGAASVLPTTEQAPFAPTSFYGLTKQVQEQMVLMFARTLGLDGLALRLQNVYGPGQSLGNPYTGLLAVFSNLARQGRDLSIFEDGLESRDFVYLADVVEAMAACLAPAVTGVHALNVGSGVRTTVLEVANGVVAQLGAAVAVRVTGAFRLGDIRHNQADISAIQALTGFHPAWRFDQGLTQFLAWAQTQSPTASGFDRSMDELRSRGLVGQAAR